MTPPRTANYSFSGLVAEEVLDTDWGRRRRPGEAPLRQRLRHLNARATPWAKGTRVAIDLTPSEALVLAEGVELALETIAQRRPGRSETAARNSIRKALRNAAARLRSTT